MNSKSRTTTTTTTDIFGWMFEDVPFVLVPKTHADDVRDFRKASSNFRFNHVIVFLVITVQNHLDITNHHIPYVLMIYIIFFVISCLHLMISLPHSII